MTGLRIFILKVISNFKIQFIFLNTVNLPFCLFYHNCLLSTLNDFLDVSKKNTPNKSNTQKVDRGLKFPILNKSICIVLFLNEHTPLISRALTAQLMFSHICKQQNKQIFLRCDDDDDGSLRFYY